MNNIINHRNANRFIVQLKYVVCILYAVCLTINICWYIDLLKEYVTKEQVSDEISYFDVLYGNYAPPASTIIVCSIYLAAFIALGLCVVSMVVNKQGSKIKKASEYILNIVFIAMGAVVLWNFGSFNAWHTAEMGFRTVLLLLISAALLYIGVCRFKGKVRMIAYAVPVILLLVESAAFSSSYVTELSFLDALVLTMTALLCTYDSTNCIEQSENDTEK